MAKAKKPLTKSEIFAKIAEENELTRKQVSGVFDSLATLIGANLSKRGPGVFTVPGDGGLDFEAITKALAGHGYEGWFVVEAEQDPKVNPPLEMAKVGHKELLRVMAAAGYEVVS